MALKAGTITTGNEGDFANSMAEAIELAFRREWDAVGSHDIPEESRTIIRAFCAAVSQGVVRYLTDHAEDAFRVHSVAATQDGGAITSTGTITRAQIQNLLSSVEIVETDVWVTQDSSTPASPNKVETVQGEGKVEILTEGVLHL
jgi:hypothetical protein